MKMALQVSYPVGEDTHFDFDYYLSTHMPLVGQHMGAHIESTLVTKGVAGGGPDAPPTIYAIASMVFTDGDALQQAMSVAGPVVADIPNFTNSQPVMLVSEVVG